MELTKEIIELIQKRSEYGRFTNMYDSYVLEWCETNGVDTNDLMTEYGCMLVTEPDNYAKLTIEAIKKHKIGI